MVHDLSTFKDDDVAADFETFAPTVRPFGGVLGVLRELTTSELLPERRPLLVLCELDCDRSAAFDLELLALGGGVDGRTARVCWRN
jgi:hypothetical protein